MSSPFIAQAPTSNFRPQSSGFLAPQLFEQTVKRSPNEVAVICGEDSLTFAELNHRAAQVATALRLRNVGPDVLVGLCIQRSLDMLVGLLGILKAGGAYVPLDPSYPPDRIRYILEDAHAPVVVTQQSFTELFSGTNSELLLMESGKMNSGDAERTTIDAASSVVTPNNLAYVIYTSGSTGRPKGVQIEHGSFSNLLASIQREPGVHSRDVMVAVATISFDIAQADMLLPLISGGRLVIAKPEETLDGRLLAELLRSSGATLMQATPATWRLLVESGWKGQRGLRVLSTGEALPVELARELMGRGDEVWNLYGPTETTIWSTIYRLHGNESGTVPIGRPIANTSIHILGEDRAPVSPGTEGELYIAGDGLARGYLNRPELTAEKFVNVSDAQSHTRMYRTGDLARLRQDGNLEYLGRIDHQVKIRGFRIELGEIEAVLEQHPSVKQAVVIAREDRPGNKFLAAYVACDPNNKPFTGGLRKHLAQSLPEYMVPAAFVQTQSFPMTLNGKVDRKLLPAPNASDFTDVGDNVAPRTEIESKLVKMWEKVLGIQPIGVRTSFFVLGGRSVLAARLFMQISKEFGKDVPLATLFEAPTIEQLATRLQLGKSDFSCRTIVEINSTGSRAPFFCVHGGTGGTLFMHGLARAMGADQPFYAFQPEGVDGGPIRRNSLKTIAAHYISEMRKIQPQGPYFFGGYCFGAVVAFEMAQQLREQAETPGVTAMFSGQLRFNRPAGERAYAPERLPQSAKAVRRNSVAERIQGGVRWRAQKLFYSGRTRFHKAGCRVMNRMGIPVPQKWRELYIVRSIQAAERSYAPKFLDEKLVIFRGAGLYDHDPGMGWSKLAREIDEHVIGTASQQKSRRDILNEPLVSDVANELKRLMDETVKAEVPPRAEAAAAHTGHELERPQDAA